jgi:hypothetical protein
MFFVDTEPIMALNRLAEVCLEEASDEFIPCPFAHLGAGPATDPGGCLRWRGLILTEAGRVVFGTRCFVGGEYIRLRCRGCVSGVSAAHP